MDIFYTNALAMEERMDANFYRPIYLKNAKKLSACQTVDFGSVYAKSGIGHTASVTTHYAKNGDGIPFVAGKSIVRGNLRLDLSERIRVDSHNDIMRKSHLSEGTLLIVRKGDVGDACVVPPRADSLNCSSEIMFFRTKILVDAYFLSSFFNSINGRLTIERLQRGSLIPGVSLYDVPDIRVLWPVAPARDYISDKARQSERLQAAAEKLLTSAIRSVESLIDRANAEDEIRARGITLERLALPQREDPSSQAKHTRTPSAALTNRIDAWYYQPHLVAANKKIKESGNCQTLADVIDAERDVKGGATPRGAEYFTSGSVRFYRTSEVSGLAVHAGDAVFITEEQDREMARSRLAEGDILLTITGADFGHAGAITKHHLPGNISQHSVRFQPTIDESYLVAYLESSYGQRMLWRQAYGATRPAVDYPGVKSLLVRVPDPSVQRVIGDAVRNGVLARDFAMWLTNAAKFLVEALIEGKITENELVDAQHALERGERQLDRAILSRLTTSGIDLRGKPPLFADLDALYAAIDETERTQPSNGDAA